MKQVLMALAACVALAGCAASAPETAAQQADDSACAAQGDAVYNANTLDEQARTAQPGLLYGATPTHVFDAEKLSALHERDSQVSNCEQNGNDSGAAVIGGGQIVPPHIVGTP
jgi:hypothetical protein